MLIHGVYTSCKGLRITSLCIMYIYTRLEIKIVLNIGTNRIHIKIKLIKYYKYNTYTLEWTFNQLLSTIRVNIMRIYWLSFIL